MILLPSLLLLAASLSSAVELTFDMDPHSEQCFYEQVEKGTDITVEFQVFEWNFAL